MTSIVQLLFALFCVVAVRAAPSSVLDANTRQSLVRTVHMSGTTLSDSVHAAMLLGDQPLPDNHKKDLCEKAKNALESDSGVIADVLDGVRLAALLDCSGSTGWALSNEAESALKDALSTPAEVSLADVHGALHTVVLLQSERFSKLTGVRISDVLGDILQAVVDLQEDDGTYRTREDSDDDGTPFGAFYAIDIVSALLEIGGLDSEDQEYADSVTEAIGTLLSEASELDEARYLDDAHKSSVYVTAHLLVAIARHERAIGKSVQLTDDSVLTRMGDFLLRFTSATSPADAFAIVYGVESLVDHPHGAALSVRIEVADVVSVTVSNIVGEVVDGVTVVLNSAVLVGKKKAKSYMSDVPLTATGSGVFTLDFFAQKPQTGVYDLDLSLSAPSQYAPLTSLRHRVSVQTNAALENAKAYVLAIDEKTVLDSVELAIDQKLGETLDVFDDQSLVVEFTVKDLSAGANMLIQQAFVVLVHVESGHEIPFIAKASSDKTYRAKISVGAYRDEFHSISGEYDVRVVVGDANLIEVWSWVAASSNLHFRDPNGDPFPSDSVNEVLKPLIHHVFREPDARPPSIYSLGFAGAIASLLALFIVVSFAFGANFAFLSVKGIAFLLCIAAIFSLFVLYFMGMNMFELMAYLGPLATVTVVVGQAALRDLAVARTKAQKVKAD